MKRIFRKFISYLSQFELFKPCSKEFGDGDVFDIFFEYNILSVTCDQSKADLFTLVFEPYLKIKSKVFNMEYKLKNETDKEVVDELVTEITKQLEKKYKFEDIWIHKDDSKF